MDSSPPLDQPIINVTGEKVALGPLRRDLLPFYLRWINDFEVTRTITFPVRSTTWEAEVRWFERMAAGEHNERAAGPASTIIFTIYERATLRPIGTTELADIEHRLRRASFGILIGEQDCWGKGYGTETVRLMLDYGFNALSLHNIMLTTQSFNERGYRAYLRAGFKEIGRRREAHPLAGNVYDVVYMDCLATEFESPVLRQMLEPPS